MLHSKSVQTEIGGYISTLLRMHFGKGPTSVFVTIKFPFIPVHIRGFLEPTEKSLLN
ncbi:Na-translocating system protein MpsC family protein [Planococcus sp. 1R117A]|uniref:Na-translocating system protein MpsC family protein n=1 Tax=Planococcus sp. 1R117A TaxID=3447020 RepID=UPI003EDC0EB4